MANHLAGLLAWAIIAAAVPVSAAETLVIPGTGDSQELLQTLAIAFEASHPGTTIDIPESIGSSGGIKQVRSGQAVLARVARPLNADERREGLEYLTFALSPVVFAAHLDVSCVSDLSTAQVVGIFSGKIGNWALFKGCPDHTIYVANREPGDSSRSVIESYLPDLKAIAEPAGKTVYSTPETVQILKRYPHTVAYAPLAALHGTSLTAFSLNGTPPTPANVRAGRYPLVVPLGVVWKGELPPLAERFLAFLFGPEAQRLIRQQGLVPAPDRR